MQAPQESQQAKAARIIRTLGIYAFVRTAFSSERSLMAWMRTCVSLYTFGFSITKFLDYLEQQQQGVQFPPGLHRLGLALICLGIIGLVLGAVGHFRRLRKMERLGLPTVSLFSLPIGAAIALLVIGVAVLVSICLS
jgi:putative membrane protein